MPIKLLDDVDGDFILHSYRQVLDSVDGDNSPSFFSVGAGSRWRQRIHLIIESLNDLPRMLVDLSEANS